MLTSKVAAGNLNMTFKEPSQPASFAMYADALSTETKNTVRTFALAANSLIRLADTLNAVSGFGDTKNPSDASRLSINPNACGTDTKNTIRAFALAGYPDGRLLFPTTPCPTGFSPWIAATAASFESPTKCPIGIVLSS
jgi:hypothetical protein